MRGSNVLFERQASAADMIAFLNADYRIRCGFDPEVDPGATLSRDTTIASWRETSDLVSPTRLAALMNEWLGMSLPSSQWNATLGQQGAGTLGDLADLVAMHGQWPDFRALTVAGATDDAAGAFFALRERASEAAPSLAKARPSTVIAMLPPNAVVAIANAVARLSPTVVPAPVVIWPRWASVATMMSAAGMLMGVVAACWWRPFRASAGVGLLATACLALFARPRSVRFGGYRTLADVSRAMAAAQRNTDSSSC